MAETKVAQWAAFHFCRQVFIFVVLFSRFLGRPFAGAKVRLSLFLRDKHLFIKGNLLFYGTRNS